MLASSITAVPLTVNEACVGSSPSVPANFRSNMPFKSKAQVGFLASHPDKIGGKDALQEWFDATPSVKALPKKVPKKKKK